MRKWQTQVSNGTLSCGWCCACEAAALYLLQRLERAQQQHQREQEEELQWRQRCQRLVSEFMWQTMSKISSAQKLWVSCHKMPQLQQQQQLQQKSCHLQGPRERVCVCVCHAVYAKSSFHASASVFYYARAQTAAEKQNHKFVIK